MSSNLAGLTAIEFHTYLVGMVAKTWALAENNLDIATVLAYHDLGGKDTFQELPRSLSKKIKMLRKCFSGLPTGHVLQLRGGDFIQEMSGASVFRNECVHGIAYQDEMDGGLNFNVALFKRLPTTIEQETRPVSAEDLQTASHEAWLVSMAMIRVLALILREVSGKEELSDLLRPNPSLRQSPKGREKRLLALIAEFDHALGVQ